MSLTPRGDGSIDPQSVEIMKGMGEWLDANGEAIYATRRWKISAEGPTNMLRLKKGGNKKGEKVYRWDFRKIGAKDVRFTRSKDNTKLYATVLGNPESGSYKVKCLAKGEKIATKGISKITHIASNTEVQWERTEEGLTIQFPKEGVSDIANAFRIEVGGKLIY